MTRAVLIVLTAAAVALTTGIQEAGATTVRALPTRVEIVGGPGQVNDLRLLHDLTRQVVRIEDRVAITTITAGGRPCGAIDVRVIECPYPAGDSRRRFVVDLGDRDDRLAIDAERANPEIYVDARLFGEIRDGPGDDRARSVPTTTDFVNGPGDDVFFGAATVTPGGGDDRITGTVGPDGLNGGAGRDVIHGGRGADTIGGGSGNDRLFGEGGQDQLFGGPGADYLRGGPARDVLSGGPGRDTQVQD